MSQAVRLLPSTSIQVSVTSLGRITQQGCSLIMSQRSRNSDLLTKDSEWETMQHLFGGVNSFRGPRMWDNGLLFEGGTIALLRTRGPLVARSR